MSQPEIGLLPGMDGTGLLFKPTEAALAARGIKARIFDYPTQEPMSLDDLTKRVWSQMADNPPPILLGESYGGQVTLRLLRDHPGVFKGVIFCVTFGTCPQPFWLPMTRWFPTDWMFLVPRPKWVLRTWTYDRKTPDQLLRFHMQATRSVAPKVMTNRFHNMRDIKPIERRVEIPALYIQADRDNLVPASALGYFETWCDNLEVARFKGPHLILQTRTEETADAIAAFMTRLGDAEA